MTIWVDAQLSPALARWISEHVGLTAHSVRDLGLRDAKDAEIFHRARTPGIIVMTKDRDFVELVQRLGPPPQILWLTCGNTTNEWLRQVLASALPQALQLFERGEPMIEITGVTITA